MVDVEQRALRAFEDQRLAALAHRMDAFGDIGDHRHELRRERERFIARLLERHFGLLEILRQHEVVIVEQLRELRREAVRVEQVLHADRAPRDLVLVGGADAAAGRADLVARGRALARLVERHVISQHQRAGRRDREPRTHVDTRLLELADFLQQRERRHDDAVADQHGNAGAQHAGRDQAQHGLPAADDQRMTGVVAALEAHDAGRLLGQPVDDLALAFIAPLGADDDDVLAHGYSGENASVTQEARRHARRSLLRVFTGGRPAGRPEARATSPPDEKRATQTLRHASELADACFIGRVARARRGAGADPA